MKHWIILSLIIASYISNSCKNGGSRTKESSEFSYSDTTYAALISGNYIDSSSLTVDSLQIHFFFNHYPELKIFEHEVYAFYKRRSFELAWHDSLGRIETFQLLFNRTMQMEEEGFADQVPYIEDFKRFANKTTKDSLYLVDLMQTAQYFHFAHHVLGGLPQQELDELEWYIPKPKKNYTDLLEQFIKGDEQPFNKAVFPEYHLLKKSLVQLREIEKKGGWPLITMTVRSLKMGVTDTVISKIKKRLSISGEWQKRDSSSLFNIELEQTIKNFQQRHGIVSDGVIGKKTIDAMNIPVEDRIIQILINMERCRWLPIAHEGDYLLINIPAFSLQVMHQDSIVFKCDAIVGKETNKTAIFKGMMKYIVLNPYWNIPTQIVEKEIVPKLAKNKDYIKDNHMEWFNGRLRQRPGPDNALGAIKFLFPNPFDIYLHDTPAKGLFKEQKRAFSHGCIRISAPHQLASYLLREQKQWSKEKMDKLLAKKDEYFITLDKEIPVYILYLTSFVDNQGNLNFREDLYNKDQSLRRMLLKN